LIEANTRVDEVTAILAVNTSSLDNQKDTDQNNPKISENRVEVEV
jgi:hypothetical protein